MNSGLGAIRLVAAAILLIGGTIPAALAAPAKPMVVLFTPGVSSNPNDPKAQADADALRAQKAAMALRDRLNETGIVDAVIYSPDLPLFERAMIEARFKPTDPAIPNSDESYTLAKAAGAAYLGLIASYRDNDQLPGAADVELHTEEIESRKQWKARRSAVGSGAAAPLTDGSTPTYNNALRSAANSLVEDFLSGPLHDLAATAPPSIAPPKPIPVERDPVPANPVDAAAPSLAVPTPVATPAPRSAPEESAAPRSSGGDTDGLAEAQRHQGEEQLRAGDNAGAILSLRKAVSLSPLNPVYRSALAGAYLSAGRNSDALSEAKRALSILPAENRKDRLSAMRLLGDILAKSGDTTAARTTYEEIIRAQPSASWARIALADLLQTQGATAEAEAMYKSVRKSNPDDKDAMLGYARLLATRGDYDGALKELTAATGSTDPAERYRTAVNLFDDGVDKIASMVEQNRTAWEAKRISQDVFYRATSAQSAKVSGLVAMLKAVPLPPDADETTKKRHSRRVLAASLLLQGVASLLSQVETGDADAGSQATVYLSEYHREMKEVVEIGVAGS